MTTPRETKLRPDHSDQNSLPREGDLASEEAMSRMIRTLPVSSIYPDANNRAIAEHEEHFTALVDSVRVLGILDPIHVRVDGERFLLVDGERRWRAARKVGLRDVQCYVWPATTTPRDTLIAGVVLNEQRQPHSCLHVARRLRELKMHNGLSGEQVAAVTGLSLDRVKTYLCLFNGSEFLLEFFAKHDVSLTIAAELIRYEKATNEARARTLALRHLESPLTREELVRRRKQDSEGPSKVEPTTSGAGARAGSLARSLERAWRRDPLTTRTQLEAALRALGFELVALHNPLAATVG